MLSFELACSVLYISRIWPGLKVFFSLPVKTKTWKEIWDLDRKGLYFHNHCGEPGWLLYMSWYEFHDYPLAFPVCWLRGGSWFWDLERMAGEKKQEFSGRIKDYNKIQCYNVISGGVMDSLINSFIVLAVQRDRWCRTDDLCILRVW